MIENRKRSAVKAVSYRLIGTMGTMVIAYIFTREFLISAGIGIADLLGGITLYYFHERIWNLIGWGKKGTQEIKEIQE